MTIDPTPGPRASARPQTIGGALIFPELRKLTENSEGLEWQPFHPGVDIHWIYREENGGHSAALIRFQPGGSVPRHEHAGFEHIYVLRGSQCDANGCLNEGGMMVHPTGTRHTISSEKGCLALAIYEKPARFDADTPPAKAPLVSLAVNGTLMRGLELNPNLLEAGAVFDRETTTEPAYRLWSINDRHPAMMRVETGGRAVAVEVWRVPSQGLASVLLKEPPGLSIGKVKLSDGMEVLGVIGEAILCKGQREITQFGGWRAYISARG